MKFKTNFKEVPDLFKNLNLKNLPVLKGDMPTQEELTYLNLKGFYLQLSKSGDMVITKIKNSKTDDLEEQFSDLTAELEAMNPSSGIATRIVAEQALKITRLTAEVERLKEKNEQLKEELDYYKP